VVTEECRLLGYKNPVRTSKETLRLRYRVQPINALYDLRFTQRELHRMPPSGMLRRVALVRTDVSEQRIASIIRVTRIGELGTTSEVTSNRRILLISRLGAVPFLKLVDENRLIMSRNIHDRCSLRRVQFKFNLNAAPSPQIQ
jgi:hypothetical protein